jgi:hypothetical protein
MSGHYIIVADARSWARQVKDALEDIRQSNGGSDPATLRESAIVNREAFARMITGLVALGVDVSRELIDLAGLHEIGDAT